MKYVIFGIALLLFVIAAVAYYRKNPGSSGTSAVTGASVDSPLTTVRFSTKFLDVGEKKLDSPVRGAFLVYNTGSNKLYIQDVLPDCHCTVASYSTAAIPPGDSTVVTLKYDSTRLGPFQSSAQISTNSNPSPTLVIFRGTVEK
jgi:hypothetical protein